MRLSNGLAQLVLLIAPAIVVSSPASAAVTTYTYQITSGSSSGPLGVGTITGGAFSVQYPNSPWYAGASVQLLSAYVSGTAGVAALTPMQLAGLGSATMAIDATFLRSAGWFLLTPSQIVQAGFSHPTPIGFPFASGNVTVYTLVFGNYGFFNFTAQEVAVPEPASSVMLLTGGLVVGAYALRRARRSLS